MWWKNLPSFWIILISTFISSYLHLAFNFYFLGQFKKCLYLKMHPHAGRLWASHSSFFSWINRLLSSMFSCWRYVSRLQVIFVVLPWTSSKHWAPWNIFTSEWDVLDFVCLLLPLLLPQLRGTNFCFICTSDDLEWISSSNCYELICVRKAVWAWSESLICLAGSHFFFLRSFYWKREKHLKARPEADNEVSDCTRARSGFAEV